MEHLEETIYCPNCGQELIKDRYIAVIKGVYYLDCEYCNSEVTVEQDKDDFTLTITKGW